jgi:LuxR family maltose regulon positive regulatory protein
VPRPRLIERLNAGLHRKLTLISAPAGFGKTTLTSEWLDHLRLDAAKENRIENRITWLSLDAGDNDPTRFLTYFIAACPEGSQVEGIGANIGKASMFYYMLYQSKLIPRFISVWGLVGALAMLATAMLDTFGISPGSLDVLGVLMLLNELFLGAWLIVKGFNPTAIASPSAQQN